MPHDGNGNDCDTLENFILTPYPHPYSRLKARNMNFFSRCSLSYLNETINKLDRWVGNFWKFGCFKNKWKMTSKAETIEFCWFQWKGKVWSFDQTMILCFIPIFWWCFEETSDDALEVVLNVHKKTETLLKLLYFATQISFFLRLIYTMFSLLSLK